MCCKNCGNKLQEGTLLCWVCGAMHREQTAPAPARPTRVTINIPPRERKSPMKAILAVVLAVVLAGGGLGLVWHLDILPGDSLAGDGWMEGEAYVAPLNEEHVETNELGFMHVNNELILFAEMGVPRDAIETIVTSVGWEVVGFVPPTMLQIQSASVKSETELQECIDYFEEHSQISSAHINSVSEMEPDAFRPNDPWGYSPPNQPTWNVDAPSSRNWGVEKIAAPYAWVHRERLLPVSVGIIDSRIDFSHEDLRGRGRTVNPTNADVDSHGTHVAGTIGANFDNGIGISGVAPNAVLLGYSIQGLNALTEKFHAINHLIVSDNVVRRSVINYSMRSPPDRRAVVFASRGRYERLRERLRDTIYRRAATVSSFLHTQLAAGHDFLIVTAAGNANYGYEVDGVTGGAKALYNSYFNAITDEEIRSRILVVGSINENFQESDFSNRGPEIFAPGENIFSTYVCYEDPNLIYHAISGTSMATPHVSGVAAMVWGTDLSLTGAQVKDIILDNTTPLATDSSVNVVNARLAVEAALARVDGNNSNDHLTRETMDLLLQRPYGTDTWWDKQPYCPVTPGYNIQLTFLDEHTVHYQRWRITGRYMEDWSYIESDTFQMSIHGDELTFNGMTFRVREITTPYASVAITLKCMNETCCFICGEYHMHFDLGGGGDDFFLDQTDDRPSMDAVREAYYEFLRQRGFLTYCESAAQMIQYAIFDIDNDGISELILRTGLCQYLDKRTYLIFSFDVNRHEITYISGFWTRGSALRYSQRLNALLSFSDGGWVDFHTLNDLRSNSISLHLARMQDGTAIRFDEEQLQRYYNSRGRQEDMESIGTVLSVEEANAYMDVTTIEFAPIPTF